MTRRRGARSDQVLPPPVDRSTDRVALVVVGAQEGWRARCADGGAAHHGLRRLTGELSQRGVWVTGVVHRRPRQRRPRRGAPPEDVALLDLGGAADAVVDSAGHDAFHGGRLEQELASAGRDTLVLAGFAAETTVSATARTARRLGFGVTVASDAVGSLELRTGGFALDVLDSLDVAALATVDELCLADRARA